MANKLSAKQIEMLLAKMPKPKQAINAVDNTGKVKPRPEENPVSKEAMAMFMGQLQRKTDSQKRYINDAGPAPVYKNVGEKVRADLERESRQRDLRASIPNEKFNTWVENVGMPAADIAMVAEGGMVIPKLLESMGKKVSPEAIAAIANNPKVENKIIVEELPGLHLKSTMEGGPISKIVEPKTGLINTEQALAIIGKESDGAKKLELVMKALGDNYPKKINYNDFRKKVQDVLIPLDKNIAEHSSDYGLNRIGYDWRFSGHEKPLENKSIILSNKEKFGTGSPAHMNPKETLGHAHYLIDKENPNIFTVTQLQSDAFQSTYGIMPKASKSTNLLETEAKSIQRLEKIQDHNKSVLNKMKTQGVDEAGEPVSEYQIKQFENIVKEQEEFNNLKKAHVENFSQKQLLDKNHQERYLQEIVDFASKKKDIDKIRIPTKETAAKVQNYTKTSGEKIRQNVKQLTKEEIENEIKDAPKEIRELYERAIRGEDFEMYRPDHQTVLKKYEENAKNVKKLFGEEPKVVTDNKGNTWYEFDIPKKFKSGKGEIKAFSTAGAAGLVGKKLLNANTVNTLQNKKKNG